MSIPEITCFLTVSNRLGRTSFRNFDYCLLLKYARDRLELSISVYLIECLRRSINFFYHSRLPILSIHLINALSFNSYMRYLMVHALF